MTSKKYDPDVWGPPPPKPGSAGENGTTDQQQPPPTAFQQRFQNKSSVVGKDGSNAQLVPVLMGRRESTTEAGSPAAQTRGAQPRSSLPSASSPPRAIVAPGEKRPKASVGSALSAAVPFISGARQSEKGGSDDGGPPPPRAPGKANPQRSLPPPQPQFAQLAGAHAIYDDIEHGVCGRRASRDADENGEAEEEDGLDGPQPAVRKRSTRPTTPRHPGGITVEEIGGDVTALPEGFLQPIRGSGSGAAGEEANRRFAIGSNMRRMQQNHQQQQQTGGGAGGDGGDPNSGVNAVRRASHAASVVVLDAVDADPARSAAPTTTQLPARRTAEGAVDFEPWAGPARPLDVQPTGISEMEMNKLLRQQKKNQKKKMGQHTRQLHHNRHHPGRPVYGADGEVLDGEEGNDGSGANNERGSDDDEEDEEDQFLTATDMMQGFLNQMTGGGATEGVLAGPTAVLASVTPSASPGTSMSSATRVIPLAGGPGASPPPASRAMELAVPAAPSTGERNLFVHDPVPVFCPTGVLPPVYTATQEVPPVDTKGGKGAHTSAGNGPGTTIARPVCTLLPAPPTPSKQPAEKESKPRTATTTTTSPPPISTNVAAGAKKAVLPSPTAATASGSSSFPPSAAAAGGAAGGGGAPPRLGPVTRSKPVTTLPIAASSSSASTNAKAAAARGGAVVGRAGASDRNGGEADDAAVPEAEQKVSYTPYTIQDYRTMMDDVAHQRLGGLGPSDTDAQRAAKEKKARELAYGAQAERLALNALTKPLPKASDSATVSPNVNAASAASSSPPLSKPTTSAVAVVDSDANTPTTQPNTVPSDSSAEPGRDARGTDGSVEAAKKRALGQGPARCAPSPTNKMILSPPTPKEVLEARERRQRALDYGKQVVTRPAKEDAEQQQTQQQQQRVNRAGEYGSTPTAKVSPEEAARAQRIADLEAKHRMNQEAADRIRRQVNARDA